MARIDEHAIGEAALHVLAGCPNGTATIQELKDGIPNYVNLSAEDRIQSTVRIGEEMWEQQVRNLISHRETQGNIVAEGLAAYQNGQLTITDSGRRHLQNK